MLEKEKKIGLKRLRRKVFIVPNLRYFYENI